MDTALPQKFPFILDRNLAKANFTEKRVSTSCDIVVLLLILNKIIYFYDIMKKERLCEKENIKENNI